jgi:transcriptional regulator with XRE-family HTH domain
MPQSIGATVGALRYLVAPALSQSQLAALAGVAPGTVKSLELSRRETRPSKLRKVIRALDPDHVGHLVDRAEYLALYSSLLRLAGLHVADTHEGGEMVMDERPEVFTDLMIRRFGRDLGPLLVRLADVWRGLNGEELERLATMIEADVRIGERRRPRRSLSPIGGRRAAGG